jgi:S-adenosylmethionine decarboxylase
MKVGTEILVDASGCNPDVLRDLGRVRAVLENVLLRCELKVIGEGQWHAFGGEGGVTGLYLLTESHLAVHTYPEHATATLNLYCCRALGNYPWEEELSRALGAKSVIVRTFDRGE